MPLGPGMHRAFEPALGNAQWVPTGQRASESQTAAPDGTNGPT
jgi:hypothetical protein